MAERIAITETISIGDEEIEERFIRAGGPGGQHVNKTSSAAQIRFDARNSPSLPEDVRKRLEALGGARISKDGVIIITARGLRSQARNRALARARLVALIRRAARPPRRRVETRTPPAEKARRRDNKTHRGAVKKLRKAPGGDD